MKVPIIYEDNHLLIVEKPINVPVQEDSSGGVCQVFTGGLPHL